MTSMGAISMELWGDDAPFNRTLDRAVDRATSQGRRAGSSFAIGFSSPLLNAVSGIQSAIGGVQTIVAGVLDVSGMRTSATFGALERTLTMISGRADTAKSAMRGLLGIAGKSNYDTDQIAEIGVTYAGKTGDVAGAVAATQNVVDAAVATGVKPVDFMEWRKNLSDIAVKGDRKLDKPDLDQLNTRAQLTRFQVGKLLGLDPDATEKKMRSMSGNEATALIKRVGEANAGIAAKQAGDNPIDIGRNIVESLKNGMAPTGGILNAIVTPVANNIRTLADDFGTLNTVTGGGAGLIGVIGGGTLAVRLFNGATETAMGGVRNLTASLLQMGEAAGVAAVAARGGANIGAGAAGGVAGGVGAAGKGASGAAGAGANVGRYWDTATAKWVTEATKGAPKTAPLGLLGMLRSRAGSLSSLMTRGKLLQGAKVGGGIVAGLLPLVAQIGAGHMAQRARAGGHPGYANTWEGISSGVGTGSLYGMIAGGLIGGVVGALGGPGGIIAGAGIGATIGSNLGGAAGGIIGGVQGANKPLSEQSAARDANTRAVQENTRAVRDMNSKALGGGKRTQSMIGSLDAEYALVRSMQTGWS